MQGWPAVACVRPHFIDEEADGGPVKMGYLQFCTSQRLYQGQAVRVHQVIAVPLEVRVRLLVDDEHHVCHTLPWLLVLWNHSRAFPNSFAIKILATLHAEQH